MKANKRTEHLAIRLTVEERKLLERLASAAHLPVASYVRQTVLAAEKEPEPRRRK